MVKKSGTKKTSLRELPKISDRVSFIYVEQFFPHTRGWSYHCSCDILCQSVFPAYAGVIPVQSASLSFWQVFSRRSGGNPNTIDIPILSQMFFPHTREWSHNSLVRTGWISVFPAEAGVIPRLLPSSRCLIYFSRTRGDDPKTRISKSRHLKFFPHTRGWFYDWR